MQGVFEFCRGLPVRPARPERLFFGLFPGTETSLHAERSGWRFICNNHLGGKRLEPERLHVSLHHVGDYKRLRTSLIYAARRAGKAVSMSPFEVTFHFIASFEGAPATDGRPPNRPLVLLGEGDGLLALHKILGAAMEKNGLRAAEHFVPHMTLAYGPRAALVQAIEPIRFVADELVLIHSRLRLTQYEIVDRWPLRG